MGMYVHVYLALLMIVGVQLIVVLLTVCELPINGALNREILLPLYVDMHIHVKD